MGLRGSSIINTCCRCVKKAPLSSLSAQTKLKMHTVKFTHGALYDTRRMYNLPHRDCCKLL
jgi:hypothetical protein